MRQITAGWIAVLCLGLLTSSAANSDAAYATCIACHGADGSGNTALGAPAIAGQSESYITRQLTSFRDGIRGAADGDTYGAQMRPFAQSLDDAAIAELAAHVSGLAEVNSEWVGEATGDPRRGANLYNGNCGACHGGKGEGNIALHSPRLTGLDAAYLKRQYANFASGVRGGTHKSDRYGRQMAMMATTLPDAAALDDVVAYIASLSSDQ